MQGLGFGRPLVFAVLALVLLFLPWPLPERQVMVMWPPCWNVTN